MIATRDGALRLCRSWAHAWRPRQRVKRAQWCERNLIFPREEAGDEKRFSFDSYPFWRGVIEAVDDHQVRKITIMGGTQIGKTGVLEGVAASTADLSPSPMMLAGPDKDFVTTLRDHLYGLLENCPPLAARIPPPPQRNLRFVDFGSCIAHLAWSGSPQRLSGRACRVVLCTEVDRWKTSPREGNTPSIIAERVKAFYRWLIIYEGTPSDEDSTIDAFYAQSDRRTFRLPCPRCGTHQELRFFPFKTGRNAGNGGIDGITNSRGEFVSPDEARSSAFYRCVRGCEIQHDRKYEMNLRGVWCPHGQRVDRKGRLRGDPTRGPRHAGFHLSSLYSPTTVTLASGGATTGAFPCEQFVAGGFALPSGFDAGLTSCEFEVSADGTTFYPLYDDNSAKITRTVAASRAFPLPIEMAGFAKARIKFSGGTAAADRTIPIVLQG